MPPSGKRVAVPASVWYTFQGDQIREIHHHLDMMCLILLITAAHLAGLRPTMTTAPICVSALPGRAGWLLHRFRG
jgi:hypothetical protein